MRPLYLVLSKRTEKTPLCGSRFWGNPDLPFEYSYPSYQDKEGNTHNYRFICQINLSELPMCDISDKLPSKGLLSFFAKIDRYLGYEDDEFVSGYISSPNDVCVLFFSEPNSIGDNKYFEEKVLIDDNGIPINCEELHVDFSVSRPSEYCEEHVLMSEPIFREWENWDNPYEDWIVLLQIDSFSGDNFNLNFMDFGVLDFLISVEDLYNLCFDSVRGIILSS